MDLIELIREVLDFNGFVVESEGVPLRARKGNERYTVLVIRDAAEREVAKHMKTEGKLLVISLDDSAEEMGDEFWNRNALERMIGRAFLSRVEGGKKPGGTIIDSFESGFAEYKEPVASVKEPESFDNEVKEAFSSSRELRPFYAYYFDVDDPEYSESGILLVGAIDKKAYRAVDRLICDTGALSTLRRMEPIISEEEATDFAMDFLAEEHTKEEDIVKEEGTVTVMEKRIINIDMDRITVKLLGILYIPFLKLEKTEGVSVEDMSGIIQQKNY